MIPDSAARRVACLAGHLSRRGEQGQDGTSLTQQVGVIPGSLYSEEALH